MQASHKVQIQDKASDKDLDHFKELHEEGGLKLEVETDANFLSTTKNLMVDLGSKALKGTLDMSEMSLPVAMLSEYTRLEIISFEYPHLCLFLHDAAGVSDPIERMKMVVSGYVASVTNSILTQKGLPPIPAFQGEKLEGVDSLGNRIILTHNSSKQDVTKVHIEGKEGLFTLDTDWENIIKFRGINISNVAGKKAKQVFITFKDGVKYVITPAEYELDGALSAQKVFRLIGSSKIEDTQNNIVAHVNFIENPKKAGLITGFFSKPQEIKKSDLNRVKIEIQQNGKNVADGSGSYSSHVEFQGKTYWRHEDIRPLWDYEHESVQEKRPEDIKTLKNLIKQKKHTEAEALMDEIKKKSQPETKK